MVRVDRNHRDCDRMPLGYEDQCELQAGGRRNPRRLKLVVSSRQRDTFEDEKPAFDPKTRSYRGPTQSGRSGRWTDHLQRESTWLRTATEALSADSP
jgi:hypothetical protein